MAESLPGDVAGVVLAAGAGTRLQPLTFVRPKALCPVGNVALVDLALARVAGAVGGVGSVAVNVHHGREQLEAHLDPTGVHVSIEAAQALGTAGALGHLRPWLDGRGALVVNADTWCGAELHDLVSSWDRERVRILVRGHEPFGPRSGVVASLLPWWAIAELEAEPAGLYEACWRDLAAAGALDTVGFEGAFVDCGTPAQYLEANRQALAAAATDASGSLVDATAAVGPRAEVERSAVAAGARIEGAVRASVVWDGVAVREHEHLDHAIRADERVTVLVR